MDVLVQIRSNFYQPEQMMALFPRLTGECYVKTTRALVLLFSAPEATKLPFVGLNLEYEILALPKQ